MIEDTRKIKDIFDCAEIISEELFPLQKWYNQLIGKTFQEITVADVLKMIRQNQFISLAVSKALVLLEDNVFAGEAYDGEILEKLSALDSAILSPYSVELNNIIEIALEKSLIHEWSYDEEEKEIIQKINAIA